MSTFVKSNDSKEKQFWNIYSIFIIEDISIFDKFANIRDLCYNCYKDITIIETFDNNITLFIYLPSEFKDKKPMKYYFSKILEFNLKYQKIKDSCKYCKKEFKYNEIVKIVKFPEILIFNLNRFINDDNTIENKVEIFPDSEIDMSSYKDPNLNIDASKTKYKLFAINNLKVNNLGIKDYYCQIKSEGKWIEIDNNKITNINEPSYSRNSCGLFYRRC